MNRLKAMWKWQDILLLVLVVISGFLLPVSAQSSKFESLTATVNGHGVITTASDEQKITSIVVVLRQDGTMLVSVCADLQLHAEGTWKVSTSSPDEVLVKITGGVLKGELTGSGKLLLTSDKKSFRELRAHVKSSFGEEMTVTFTADALKPSN